MKRAFQDCQLQLFVLPDVITSSISCERWEVLEEEFDAEGYRKGENP